MLQGYDTGSFPDDDKTLFLDKLQGAIPHSSEWQADLYFIHDFQLAPLAAL
jgi:hypothetical protein